MLISSGHSPCLGGHGPGIPPVAPGRTHGHLRLVLKVQFSSFELLLAEGDSVERSDRNVLQGTLCFQL